MFLDGCLDMAMARSWATSGGVLKGAIQTRSATLLISAIRPASAWPGASTLTEGLTMRIYMRDIHVEINEDEIEKTGNSEFVVYRTATGPITLLMRHPGGAITSYDGRFGELPEGQDQMVIPA